MDRTLMLLPLLALVALGGCATRDWVRDMLGQREAAIGQRIEGVEGRVANDAQRADQRIGGVEGRVGGVEGRVSSAEERLGREGQRLDELGSQVSGLGTSVDKAAGAARAARERADEALARAEGADSRLGRIWTNRYRTRVAETVEVYFAFGKSDLRDAAQTELARLARDLQKQPTLTVELAGYTDPVGSPEYNYQLSQRRVEAVRRYLAQQGIELARIQSVSMGPIADRSLPPDKKRRVTVKVLADQD
jgi:outer membrane protein OmpA-like peptidoglycan-associated protein